jgi:uncharacterized membrane protein YedE/YeeE
MKLGINQRSFLEHGKRMKSLVLTISLPLAILLGFTAHRAGLCMVRAVAEVFSTRQAYMLVTILKTVLWVMAVSVSIHLFFPDASAPNRSYAITAASIIGGLLFGVGAAVNGGCALSTLGHLANGNLWMLTTIFGFCIGVAGLSIMAPLIEPSRALMPLLLNAPRPLIGGVLALFWLLLCWETVRLWKSRARGKSWIQLFLSRHYRLSTAALVLGFTGGVLYVLHGSWTYSNALRRQVQSFLQPIDQSVTINLLLFLALFCGMLLSTWQRGSFKLRWRRIQNWPRHLIGGVFMGGGAVLIPGGNDTLMLKSLPGLSPHAMPAFVALLFGIGLMLVIFRRFTGQTLNVVCTNDICRTED